MGAFGPDDESFDALTEIVYQSKVSYDDGADLGCSSTEDGLSTSSGSEKEYLPGVEDVKGDNDKVEHTVGEIASMRKGAARTAPKDADVNVLLTHRTRGTAHWGHVNNEKKLACGKVWSHMYDEVDIKPEETWPRCSDCFPE